MKTIQLLSRALAAIVAPLCFAFAAPTWAADVHVEPSLQRFFSEAGVDGTFVLYDASADRLTASDAQRANQRFIPASTFKMLNSLIALETKAVLTPDEVFAWDGSPQPYKSWERDMTMRDAVRESAVPVFQQIARRIGLERMRDYVARAGFGNAEIGNVVDRFWLDGPLEISAREEALFATRLGQRRLPFAPAVQLTVRDLLAADQGDGYRVFAKTGYSTTASLGWYTGWVERDDRVYGFSVNIDLKSEADLPKRKSIAMDALRALNILPRAAGPTR